ncbi:MAG: flagellar M-ring protein FliF [Butyrivibrio sp.]|uniref:flagellar basal-body MS-ring/collar protein FliF n=1 Tax=Butyrivibrio sp. TaxID=28121 RepID=UPI0025F4A986|nr:flagellar basal-body MS-ring/collar protein FliF [Butyrivibrio sp.]MCR5772249.1 flagellar M-ring protein FliF [Butyrivibrio sp.]
MQERLKAILDRIKEWWNRFTTKQKTMIVAVSAGALVTLAILIMVFSQPKYVILVTADDTAQAAEIRDLLEENSVNYQLSEDALVFRVREADQQNARLLLAANGVQADDYTIDNVTDSSFTTTESDKQKKYVTYMEKKLEKDLASIETINWARVTLHVPEDDGTLLASQESSTASILVELEDPENFTEDNAAFIAKIIAAALGNENTEGIVIIDSLGNMLYAGEDQTSIGIASSQLTLKQKAEASVRGAVRSVILGTNLYDNVEVGTNLAMDFSTIDDTVHTYTPVDGGSQGVLSSQRTYSSESSGGETGVPGTDTNDDTTYVTEDTENYSQSVSEEEFNYLPNERITTTNTPPGSIDYENSSVSVSAINYVVMNEDDYKAEDHDGMTWNEYKLANTSPVDVTETIDAATLARLQNLVANATGIDTENITVGLFEQNVYFDSEGFNVSLTDLLQIILILVILALLAFVIIRSLRSERQEEVEDEPEELSVEQLLESQPEEAEALENIEMDEGSETKHLIEEFVEQNPEAAANLLRNWLNDDYA